MRNLIEYAVGFHIIDSLAQAAYCDVFETLGHYKLKVRWFKPGYNSNPYLASLLGNFTSMDECIPVNDD